MVSGDCFIRVFSNTFSTYIVGVTNLPIANSIYFYEFMHVAQIDRVTLFANVLPSIFYHTIMTMYLMIPNFSNLTLIEIDKLLFHEFNNFKGTLRVNTHDIKYCSQSFIVVRCNLIICYCRDCVKLVGSRTMT